MGTLGTASGTGSSKELFGKPLGTDVASISGSFVVGGVVVAKLADGVLGNIQFTRTLKASPFTKTNISGAVANAVNTLSYTIQSLDQDYKIGYDYSAIAGTVESIPVAQSGAAVAPAIVSAISIIGTPTVGSPVSATAAVFSGTPTPSVVRTWTVAGVTVSTAATYTPVSADANKALVVREVATNSAGSVTSTSASVTISVPTSAPTVVTEPTINGSQTAGNVVTSTPATFNGNPTPTIVTTWLIDGTQAGTGSSFTLPLNSGSKSLVRRDTATNSAGSISSDSQASIIVDATAGSLYTVEVVGYSFPPRIAAADPNRTLLKVRHKAGPLMEIGTTTNANEVTNGPSSWVSLGLGRELEFDSTDRVKQVYVRPAASVTRQLSAVTFPNVNTARGTLVGHGFASNDLKSFTGFVDSSSTSSRRLNQSQVPITVIDADTFEWPLSVPVSSGATVSTLGRVYDGSGLVEVEFFAKV